MARNRKAPPQQAKHFRRDDHAHAAHQEETSHGHPQKPGPATEREEKSTARSTDHPMERTPRGPSKGQ